MVSHATPSSGGIFGAWSWGPVKEPSLQQAAVREMESCLSQAEDQSLTAQLLRGLQKSGKLETTCRNGNARIENSEPCQRFEQFKYISKKILHEPVHWYLQHDWESTALFIFIAVRLKKNQSYNCMLLIVGRESTEKTEKVREVRGYLGDEESREWQELKDTHPLLDPLNFEVLLDGRTVSSQETLGNFTLAPEFFVW